MEDRRTDVEDQRTNVEDQRTNVEDQRTNVEDQRTNVEDQRTNVEDQRIVMTDQRTNDALKTLTLMFPDVDIEICEAVLNEHNGELESSINSLLGMSDPNFSNEEAIPIQTESGVVTSTTRQQIESDEELARRLAAEADKELPVIKEKIIQAADTTKKKVKEWYEKFRQQASSSPKNEDQYSNAQYTNLPRDEADNPMLGEDFSESMNLHKNK
ncbi:20090_t:CDS:2 [Dentiscutata erythropus]|uniref:20090_t:CDS:1 n=1 Tax=Dentiscutata erythropus TaxID=1348616 RepID=A0A9N9CPX3_9GLOM|nr:20090_t:CDS:2 [Dentiscutata erythropus]